MNKVKKLLNDIIDAVVENHDAVVIAESNDDLGVLISLKVGPEDMGKVIGKQGETAKAIRHLLRVVGASQKARVSLKIDEPDGGTKRGEDVNN